MKAHFLVKITSFVHVPFLIVACTNPREIQLGVESNQAITLLVLSFKFIGRVV